MDSKAVLEGLERLVRKPSFHVRRHCTLDSLDLDLKHRCDMLTPFKLSKVPGPGSYDTPRPKPRAAQLRQFGGGGGVTRELGVQFQGAGDWGSDRMGTVS